MTPLTCGVEVFRIVMATPSSTVVTKHQSNCEEHEKEAESDHDSIAAPLV
jgi:hypothetical protein